MKTRNAAFTLIELLVVIAIIAILAAILFPVFAQAKVAAKKTVALSNAKNLATANMIYQGDFDDALIKEYFGFPSNCWSAPPYPTVYYSWHWALYPYTAKSNALLTDPTNTFQDKSYWQWAAGYNDTANSANSVPLSTNYAVNNALIGFANGNCTGGNTPPGQDSLSGVSDVAGTIMMLPSRAQYQDLKWHWGAATGWTGGISSFTDTSWCLTNKPDGSGSVTCPASGNGPIHQVGKQSTWVWADGHAKSRAYTQTLRLSDSQNDDWASNLSTNPATGNPWTQADRVFASQHLFPEYK